MSITRLNDRIYRIDMGRIISSISGSLVHCSLDYLIVQNGKLAIIDTGPAIMVPHILESIETVGYEPSQLQYIILTHIHLDHAGGVGALARLLPKAVVMVHERGVRHIIEPEKLIEQTVQAYGQRYEDEYGPISPVPEHQVRAVYDGEVIALGERELRVIYTPGHAVHHLCVYDTNSQALFSGDSLGLIRTGADPIFTLVRDSAFDLDLAIYSIDEISALNPKYIYASHGSGEPEIPEFIQLVRTMTIDYGNIILKAMKSGEDKETIERHLETYQAIHNMEGPLANIVRCYAAYFTRKGIEIDLPE